MENTNKYVVRLYNEWKQHGKIVLSLDYDSTLFPYHTIDNQDDIDRTIHLAKLARETGAYIVIFTASDPSRYPEIMEYCQKIGIQVDSINKNPIDLPYGTNGKIYYNINICDRSGIYEALDILETEMYMVRGDQHSPSDIG